MDYDDKNNFEKKKKIVHLLGFFVFLNMSAVVDAIASEAAARYIVIKFYFRFWHGHANG